MNYKLILFLSLSNNILRSGDNLLEPNKLKRVKNINNQERCEAIKPVYAYGDGSVIMCYILKNKTVYKRVYVL